MEKQLTNFRERGYLAALEKLGAPPEEEDGLPWWLPLAGAGAAGLGAYGLARIPFRAASKYPILQRIRELAGGKMIRPDILEHQRVDPGDLSRMGKLKRMLKYGPEMEEEALRQMAKGKKDPLVAWQADNIPIEGTLNPALGASTKYPAQSKAYDYIAKLDDKLQEAILLQKHAPGTMARTTTLPEMLKKHNLRLRKGGPGRMEDLGKLQEALKKEFGSGYIMKTKGARMGGDPNVASSGVFPTEKTDLVKALEQWRAMKPEFTKARREATRMSNVNEAIEKFRTRPGYEGRVVDELLRDNVIIQERLALQGYGKRTAERMRAMGQAPTREYRVHVVGGQAAPYLAMPRYAAPDPRMIPEYFKARQAAKWAQKNVIDKLPEQYRGLSYGMDVAPLKGGGYGVIELNTGGASGLLTNPLGSHMLHKAVTGRFSRPAAAMIGAGAAGAGAGVGGIAKAVAAPDTPTVPPGQKRGLVRPS